MKEGEREEGEREKERAMTRPQPSILRFIRNPAAFAATSPTLLFRPWRNAAPLKRNALSDELRCDGSTAAFKCAAVSRWALKRRARGASVQRRLPLLTALLTHTTTLVPAT